MTFITGPIPAYQNLPIEAQYYQPSRFVIEAIALGVTTLVTTTKDLNYKIGQQVRFIIPPSFGTRQLNEQQGLVIDIPMPNQAVVNINSTNYDSFILSSATTQAQIIPIGDVNSGQINENGPQHMHLGIPGSFINISPN